MSIKKLYILCFFCHIADFKDNERMKELGQEMLKYCAGLPLAIVVLGGLLSTKYTIDEWEMMRNVKKPERN